jgi:hypothetical protein
MDMVGHNNKTIEQDTFIVDQEPQAVDDDFLSLIFLKQVVPVEAGSREEFDVRSHRINIVEKYPDWSVVLT